MRSILAVITALTLLGSATSQDPEMLKWSREKLGSDKTKEVALGAFVAAQEKLKDALPQLREALRLQIEGQRDNHVIAAILDALIRIDARMTAVSLQGLPRAGLSRPSLVLASHNPRDHAALFLRTLQREEHGKSGDKLAWLAAGNLLLAQKSERFAGLILAELPARIRLTVREASMSKDSSWPKPKPQAQHAPSMPGNTRGGYTIPFRYPNYGYYQLATAKGADDRFQVLADGPTKIMFRRVRKKSRKYKAVPNGGDWDNDRMQWIATMTGGDPKQIRTSLRRHDHHAFATEEAYLALMKRVVAEARAAHTKLITNVRKAGFLRKASVDPAFDIEVYDIRGPESLPLPQVAGVRVLRKHPHTATSKPTSKPGSRPTSRPTPVGK